MRISSNLNSGPRLPCNLPVVPRTASSLEFTRRKSVYRCRRKGLRCQAFLGPLVASLPSPATGWLIAGTILTAVRYGRKQAEDEQALKVQVRTLVLVSSIEIIISQLYVDFLVILKELAFESLGAEDLKTWGISNLFIYCNLWFFDSSTLRHSQLLQTLSLFTLS